MFTGEAELLGSKMVSPFRAVAQPSGGRVLFKAYKGTSHPDIPRDCVFLFITFFPCQEKLTKTFQRPVIPLLRETKLLKCERINWLNMSLWGQLLYSDWKLNAPILMDNVG